MGHLMNASAAAVILLAGCSDTGAPGATGSEFDAVGVDGNLETVRQVLDDAAWQSLRALGPRFGAAGVRIARAILSGGPARHVAPQLPPAVRGTTFVLDSITLQYVPDSSRHGAPANGVRFILYAADPATHQPLPGQEIGYADLTDEGDPLSPEIALRLRAVIAGLTRLDYRVVLVGTDSAAMLQAVGFSDDGARRVEFRVGVRGARAADTTATEVAFAIGIPANGFLATATLQHVTLTGDSAGAIAMTVRQGFNQVGMMAQVMPLELTAVFQVNGIPFATARGDPAHPTVRGADGRDLTAEEVDALIGIQRLTGSVFEMFDCLMQPVGGILGVGAAG